MATKAELREVVDNALAAEREKIVRQVKRELLYESDVFPTDKSRRISMNDVLARTWTRLSSKT
jgi:hypothetical protein